MLTCGMAIPKNRKARQTGIADLLGLPSEPELFGLSSAVTAAAEDCRPRQADWPAAWQAQHPELRAAQRRCPEPEQRVALRLAQPVPPHC